MMYIFRATHTNITTNYLLNVRLGFIVQLVDGEICVYQDTQLFYSSKSRQ